VGVVGGAYLAAVAGLFNEGVIEALKGSVMSDLQTVSGCTTAPSTPQTCFSTLVTTDVLFGVVLPMLVLGLLFGVLYGMYYEYLPGRGYGIRALGIGTVLLILLVILGATGNYSATNTTMLAILRAFDTIAIVGYAFISSRLYRRLTREVQFESADPSNMKMWVDGKNYTDKTKTLPAHSNHKIRNEGGRFHQWLVSGGVSVADPKSEETTMRVDGDGLLKVS